MNKIASVAAIAALGIVAAPRPGMAGTRPAEFQVVPFERNDTLNLVRAAWEKGTGCPNTGDPAYICRTDASDTDDRLNQGLLLAKSGSGLGDPGQAGATLVGVQGQRITDLTTPILGYDIRRDGKWMQDAPSGSHCGKPSIDFSTGGTAKGSPRFEVQIGGYWYYIPCGAETLPDPAAFQGWLRLQWTAASLLPADVGGPPIATLLATGPQQVTTVQIVFDASPDDFELPADALALAVLDNIFAFNRVEGDGSVAASHPSDEDEGGGKDKDRNSCEYRHSDSHPERNKVSYYDPDQKMRMSSTNIRSATYEANCVNLVGDALVNGKSGYTYTYQACDLSTGLTPGIGTYSISINGPGVVYSKSAPMTSGFVYIHPHL
jgi:hypothetical protein